MKTKKAFTLIELLVVIAIISLLVSILLPSLKRAKDLARKTLCMSNLHGASITMEMYGVDNERITPPPYDYERGEYWTEIICNSVGDESMSAFSCPLKEYSGTETHPAASYGIPRDNHRPSANINSYIPTRILEDPSEIVLLVDSVFHDTNAGKYSQSFSVRYYTGVPAFNPRVMHFRHLEKLNVMYTDGHVETAEPVDSNDFKAAASMYSSGGGCYIIEGPWGYLDESNTPHAAAPEGE